VELAVTSRMSGSERSRSAVLLKLSCGMTTDMFRYRAAWDVRCVAVNEAEFGFEEPCGTALDYRVGTFPSARCSGR
jgi:hypothetical protein